MRRSVSIESSHTAGMIREELESLRRHGTDFPCASFLTMGVFLELRLRHSPFVEGGILTHSQLQEARTLLGGRKWTAEEISGAVACAFRGTEIIVPEHQEKQLSPDYSGFCPEWIADVFAAVCKAAPSTTWAVFMDEMPLVLALHLAASAYRASGGHTMRPVDFQAELEKLNRERKQDEESAGLEDLREIVDGNTP